jgi:protein-S-isoprenylcysteine O-methyltransferase Ste14
MIVSTVVVVWKWPDVIKDESGVPRFTWLILLFCALPLVTTVELPLWMALGAVSFQVSALILEWTARWQLLRANSYGINASSATTVVRNGAYVFEHPIYLSILLHLFGYWMFAPISLLGLLPIYVWLREKVQRERVHLAQVDTVPHRGLEGWIWD